MHHVKIYGHGWEWLNMKMVISVVKIRTTRSFSSSLLIRPAATKSPAKHKRYNKAFRERVWRMNI